MVAARIVAATGSAVAQTWATTTQAASPHAIEIPPWFAESFLNFKNESAATARQGTRLMLYSGQDGCPSCRELITNCFSQKPIVEKSRKHFVAVARNLFGDRKVTWIDGRHMNEKGFARLTKEQFTPSLLFIDSPIRMVTKAAFQDPHKETLGWENILGMTIGQAVTWASQNIDPKHSNPVLTTSEPYVMGPHATCSGVWARGTEDYAPSVCQWGCNPRMTGSGLFGAADTIGGTAHRFSSGSFTEGRIAAEATPDPGFEVGHPPHAVPHRNALPGVLLPGRPHEAGQRELALLHPVPLRSRPRPVGHGDGARPPHHRLMEPNFEPVGINGLKVDLEARGSSLCDTASGVPRC